MPRITLPEGARAVAMDGSDRYTAGPGDRVTVSAGHAKAIRERAARGYRGGVRASFGTKTGRWCAACRRLWNAWSVTCPACHGPTDVPE